MASAAVVSERTRSAPATAASVSGASGDVDGSGSKPRTVAPAARRSPAIVPPASPTPRVPIAATLRRPGPLAFVEDAPQHLARRGLRDRVDDLDPPQLLVGGHALGDERLQLLDVELCAG